MNARLPAVMLLIACGAPEQMAGKPVSEGGEFDLRLCGPAAVMPVSSFPVTDSVAPVALAVCGWFQADHPTTVTGDARVVEAVRIAAPVEVSGSFWAGATVTSPNTLEVGKDFTARGDWALSSLAHVHGDATVAGALQHDSTLMVDGTLAVGRTEGSGSVQAGAVVISPASVAAPLDCSGAPDAHAAANDAAAHPDPRASTLLDPEAMLAITQPSQLLLGCGRYVIAGLDVNATLTVHVAGPTVWVIRGDVNISAPVVFDIAEGASLELIVDGALNVDGTLTVGDPAHPGIVAVAGAVRISAPTHLYGALLAPRSMISADHTLEVFGSMYVGSTHVSSPLTVHEGVTVGVEGWPMVAR